MLWYRVTNDVLKQLQQLMAGWQSGYAAACKAVYAGSIPAPASITSANICHCPGGEIGRHKGLKIPRT